MPNFKREKHNQTPDIRHLLITHMFYSFIVSAMAVMVPLYLVDKNVDIALIGFILSIGPISFMIIRILFASVADEVGTKIIATVYSASNILAIILYIFIISPLGFIAATLSEGVRTSGFWAVARTEVFDVNGTANAGTALARFSNMRQLADGLGRLVIGFVLAYFAFQGAFLFVLLLSLVLLVLVLLSHERNEGNFRIDKKNIKRIFKKHPPTFWYAALLQMFVWLPYNTLLGFVIPVYMASSLKMGYSEVGLSLAGLSIAAAAFAIILMRANFSRRNTLLLTLLSVPALVMFPFVGSDVLLPLCLLAVGTGCSNIIGEYILVDQVYRSKDVSTDIGVLYAPLKLAEFSFLCVSGLVIATFGFAPLFFVLALSMALFVLLGSSVICERVN